MKKNKNKNREVGSLKWILIIIIVLGLASYYFGFSVQNVVQNPQTQANFNYVWGPISNFWNTNLASTANYLWNDIFINIIWANFVAFLQSL